MSEKYASPELIIGLTSAVGTDITLITEVLREQLAQFHYETKILKLSKEILVPMLTSKDTETEFKRSMALMSAGNNVRKTSKNKGMMACAAANMINDMRYAQPNPKEPLPQIPSTAFVITSLKHPSEVERLREIYLNSFFLFAINEKEESRIKYLHNKNIGDQDAKELVERDADEGDPFGQHTRDVFEMADFHLTLNVKGPFSDKNEETTARKKLAERQISRILDLLFGSPFITPTFDEYAMFIAYSSALRSADLSRQVGAVIANGNNDIISTGTNEVPRFGGGHYWPDPETYSEPANGRDWIRGYDANKKEHQRIIEEIVDGYTYDDASKKSEFRDLLTQSRIKYLTEYGRAVHAEMAAIVACARTGISLNGATLYCTTFPCHNCAKHIINAGIKRVIYIEPYPKSKTFELYDDSASMEPVNNKVCFEEFVGIGPRRFFDLFSLKLSNGKAIIRKNKDGTAVMWDRNSARLRFQTMPISYIEKEGFEGLKWEMYKNNSGG